MDTSVWMGCVLLLVSVKETLTQDQQPSMKNPDDSKYDIIIAIITTLGIIALFSVVATLLIYFCQRRERNTHESSKDTDASIPMVKVTGTGIDNVSSHLQTSED